MAMPWSLAKAKAAAIRADKSGRMLADLTRLFYACFRIQREACEAAGRHIPLIVENVRGAQPWVGRARFNYSSYYLWGDVPALMPRPEYCEGVLIRNCAGIKNGGDWFGSGEDCSEQRRHGSGSTKRKFASAMIAKIPEPLAEHIGRTYWPGDAPQRR